MGLLETLGLQWPGGTRSPTGGGDSAAKKVRFDPVVTQIPEGGSAIRIGQGRVPARMR